MNRPDLALRPVLASRWTDDRGSTRLETSVCPDDRHVVSVALRRTSVRLLLDSRMVFDGVMYQGATYVTSPSQRISAEFREPCDFIHFHVANELLQHKPESDGKHSSPFKEGLTRDDLIGHLCRALVQVGEEQDFAYVESLGRAVVARLLVLQKPRSAGQPLQGWRLRRVLAFINANLEERLCLEDLAEAAGLSRMHFAAQFRRATGFRPHDYVLAQRIETASLDLTRTSRPIVDIALSVGFQSQAHFTTAFRRATGSTPARWRRATADRP